MLVLCGTFLCACNGDISDPDVDATLALSSAKAIYDSDNNTNGYLLDEYAEKVLDDIMSVYIYSSAEDNALATILNDNTITSDFAATLVDSIRLSYYFHPIAEVYYYFEIKWAWSLGLESYFNDRIYSKGQEQTLRNVMAPTANETLSLYKQTYLPALTSVLYELALDITPSEFKVTYRSGFEQPTITTKDNLNISTYLDSLKQRYINEVSYKGIKQEDKQLFEQYILKSVIGKNSLDYSNKNQTLITVKGEVFENALMDDKKYYEVVEAVLNNNYTDRYHEKKCISGLDISALNLGIKELNDYTNIPAKKYQSLILEPNILSANNKVSYISFGISSEDKNLEMDCDIIYHDIKNGVQTTSKIHLKTNSLITMSPSDQKYFGDIDVILYSINNLFDGRILNFSQETTITDETPIGASHKLSDMYKTNENNAVCINHSALSSNFSQGFLEFVFYNKTSSTPFKFGISSILKS